MNKYSNKDDVINVSIVLNKVESYAIVKAKFIGILKEIFILSKYFRLYLLNGKIVKYNNIESQSYKFEIINGDTVLIKPSAVLVTNNESFVEYFDSVKEAESFIETAVATLPDTASILRIK